jgi:hypothetical protein
LGGLKRLAHPAKLMPCFQIDAIRLAKQGETGIAERSKGTNRDEE